MNSSTSSKEIESFLKNIPQKKTPNPTAFTIKSYQTS